MKVVCVRNSKYLTCGKTYEIIKWTISKMSVYITNDIGKEDIFSINYFLYQEEWRNKQLNELGI